MTPLAHFAIDLTATPFYSGMLRLPWWWHYLLPTRVARRVPPEVLALIHTSRGSSAGELLFFWREANIFSHCVCGLVNAEGRLVAIYHFRHDHASRN